MRTKSTSVLLKKKMKRPPFAKAYAEVGYLLDIGVTIAKAREKVGLSQGELAKRLKTTQSVISRIENGNQNISLNMLAKIASVLHCELSIRMKPAKKAA